MATTLSEHRLKSLRREGQWLYHEKDFKAALLCFNQVVTADWRPPLEVLDGRAATLIKLGNLRLALKDGRQMITQERTNSCGYLRTGQILHLMAKPEQALDIYQLGRARVSPKDPTAKLLKEQLDKLTRILAPPKAVDPFLLLPPELALMVLAFLGFKDVLIANRVSRKWRKFLTSLPNLWVKLDLSSTSKRPITIGSVRKYVGHANGQCTRTVLGSTALDLKKVLPYITSRCKNLQELQLSLCPVGESLVKCAPAARNLRSIILTETCEVSAKAAGQVLELCESLERAEFYSVCGMGPTWSDCLPNLKVFRFDRVRRGHKFIQIGRLDLTKVLLTIPNVRHLSLGAWTLDSPTADFSGLIELETLNLHGSYCRNLHLIFPPFVKALDLQSMGHFRLRPSIPLPRLIELSVSTITDAAIEDLLRSRKGKLLVLKINVCVSLEPLDYEYCLIRPLKEGFFEQLQELDLRGSSIDDRVVSLISKQCPNLRVLSLRYSKVTGVGIRSLIENLGGKLESVDLRYCDKLAIDAVDLLRSKGVKVAFEGVAR